MGMAASQARYLALTARKTNVEYEGQQINQARTSLANQTANLFNQMMGMSVPTPPSKADYTKVQYSFSDGVNTEVLSNYYQIGTANEDYNYVVTTYHNEKVFTGSKKKLSDPQVQYASKDHWTFDPNSTDNIRPKIVDRAVRNTDGTYTIQTSEGTTQIFRQVQPTDKAEAQVRAISLGYGIAENGEADLSEAQDVVVDLSDENVRNEYAIVTPTDTKAINTIKQMYGIGDDQVGTIPQNYYYNATTNTYVSAADYDAQNNAADGKTATDRYDYTKVDPKDEDTIAVIAKLYGLDDAAVEDIKNGTTVYYTDGTDKFVTGADYDAKNATAVTTFGYGAKGGGYYTDGNGNFVTQLDLENAVTLYNQNQATGAHDPINVNMLSPTNNPTFSNYTAVGNCRLEELSSADLKDEDTKAEIDQIIKDMKKADGSQISAENLMACFETDPNTGELVYKGGLYSFTMNGQKCYTTQKDLAASAGTSIVDNEIDTQQGKLAYYTTSYIDTQVEDTQKALLETDGQGRFKTIKLEDDSVVYSLNAEASTDEDSYNDAMNRYYYEKEVYEKNVSDINARTEVIQAQDRTLELRLEQLNTEQNALQNEMEAVKKVVDKHVELGFKTFGG